MLKLLRSTGIPFIHRGLCLSVGANPMYVVGREVIGIPFAD